MNHIQFETNGVRVLAVGVSDDAYDFKMMESKFLYPGELILTYKSPVIWDNYKKRSWVWDTKGQYEIHAISTDLTDEQLKVLVKKVGDFGYFDYDQDAKRIEGLIFYEKAINSFNSLLRSKGVDPTEKYVILIETQTK